MTACHRRKFLFAALTLPIVSPAGGCASVWQFLRQMWRDPEIRLRRLQVESITLDSVKARFYLEAMNPNPLPIHLAGLVFALDLDGQQALKGSIDRPIDLSAQGKAEIVLPMEVPLGSTLHTILRLLNQKSVTYALHTRFHFRGGQARFAIPLRFSGDFPVPKLPLIQVLDFRLTTISPAGLGVSLAASVTNPNPFSLPLERLYFRVKINGQNVVHQQALENLQLKPMQTRDVRMNFQMDWVAAGLTAMSFSHRQELSWAVDGGLEAGLVRLPVNLSGRVRLP